MSKSLADLRARKAPSRPERSYTVCLAQHLVAEVEVLNRELLDIEPARDDDGERQGPPRRLADGDHPRKAEIQARLMELLREMEDHEGELRLRAVDDGDWRRWTNAHPGRDKDEPGHQRDQDVTFGYCNADDLIEALGDYAVAWNGERLDDGDWADTLAPSVSAADKKQIATLVVAMHESDVSIPKWRSALSANLRSESA